MPGPNPMSLTVVQVPYWYGCYGDTGHGRDGAQNRTNLVAGFF
jgi:hypothetical protein